MVSCRVRELRKAVIRVAVLVMVAVLTVVGSRCSGAGSSPAIRFYDHTTVSTTNVRLGDIAAVEGMPEEAKTKLEAVVIGKAPLVGSDRLLQVGYVKVRLRQAGFDPDEFHLVEPESGIRVTTAGQTVRGADIAQAVREEFARFGKTVIVDPVPDLITPEGKVQVRVTPQGEQGVVAAPVAILVDGRPIKHFTVRVQIDSRVRALVFARDMARGEIVTPSDVETVEIRQPVSRYVQNLSEIVGKQLTRWVRRGSAVTPEAFRAVPDIFAGQKVKIIYEKAGLSIQSEGVAKEDGYKGQVIAVENSVSGLEIAAQVVSSDTVRVE